MLIKIPRQMYDKVIIFYTVGVASELMESLK